MHDGTRVRRDDDSRVHRDGEAMHDHTGRIHRENEALVHDKGKVYYDPRGDYSYDEAKMNAAAAAFNAHYAQQAQPAPEACQAEACGARQRYYHGRGIRKTARS